MYGCIIVSMYIYYVFGHFTNDVLFLKCQVIQLQLTMNCEMKQCIN